MFEVFQRIIMKAFRENIATIYIGENTGVIFEKDKRFKSGQKKTKLRMKKKEILKLIQYIKYALISSEYTIKPFDCNVFLGEYQIQINIMCIPSMYFEKIILRIISSKRKSSNNKYNFKVNRIIIEKSHYY